MFKTTYSVLAFLLALTTLSACKQGYKIDDITCEQITMDASFDAKITPEMQQVVDFYKQQIDSVMTKQIGYADVTMTNGKPQSLLANFTSDVLRLAGEEFTQEPIQLAVMNNGGLRAAINEGPVTVGDIFKVFPFENAMVVLKLNGVQVKELFKRIAAIGGEGVSGCELVIRDNKVESLKVGGKAVEDTASYWISTIDYLADGNSGMSVLLEAEKRINTGVLLRDVMINYVEGLTAAGKPLTAKIDNRIEVLR